MRKLLAWWRRLYEALLEWAASPGGIVAIALVAFAEASFFPVPPDVLIVAAVLARSRTWVRAALAASVASVLGGILGYGIGWGAWEALDDFFYAWVPGFDPEVYARVAGLYEKWNFWVVFAAGFTPIPYKVFTIAAGVARIDFPVFVLASALSRSARFFLVAGLLRVFGPRIRPFIDRWLGWLTLLFVALLIGGFVAVGWWSAGSGH